MSYSYYMSVGAMFGVMNKYGCVLEKKVREELKALEQSNKATFKKRLYYPVFKRCADIVCSLVALVILIITFPFIAVAIKLDSAGPVIFAQLRVGKMGNLIKIYKLRTMRQDAEEMVDNSIFKNKDKPFVQRKNDPRVTKVGKFLRRFSIDELPQLFCVLKGNMSFVGPRPFIPEETNALSKDQLERLIVKPGLTGYAQINGRNTLNLEERMEYDLYYIQNMSAWFDIKILWHTIINVITAKGVS